MTKNTLFFTHIPKCGGNGIHNIFKNIGYDLDIFKISLYSN